MSEEKVTITYKVWVHIECIVSDGDDEVYDDLGLPTSIGTFDSREEAESLVSNLQMEV